MFDDGDRSRVKNQSHSSFENNNNNNNNNNDDNYINDNSKYVGTFEGKRVAEERERHFASKTRSMPSLIALLILQSSYHWIQSTPLSLRNKTTLLVLAL